MLAGTQSGGDVRAFQQLVAGVTPNTTPDDGPLSLCVVQNVSPSRSSPAARLGDEA